MGDDAIENYQVDIAAHELGHALGLCHDYCRSSSALGLMWEHPKSNQANTIFPEHCAIVENPRQPSCDPDDGQADNSPPPAQLADGEPAAPFPRCCFFCGPSRLNRKCSYAPELCGTIRPPNGICIYEWTRTLTWGTQESYFDGQVHETFGYSDITRGTTTCYDFLGQPLEEGVGEDASDYGGAGPVLFTRTRYPDGASGHIPVTGVARDDIWGVHQLYFWLDGEPVSLQGLETGLYDPWTCSETPSPTCDAMSRFTGTLDVSGLAAGTHQLVVAAVNGRGDPIPTYYEQIFLVGVDPCAGDGAGPAVQVTSPVEGAILTAPAAVQITTSDPAGVTAVDLYVDGAYRQVVSAAPWIFSWDAPAAGAGQHRLRAKAYDTCGNVRFSPEVTVEVAQNGLVTRTYAPVDDTWSNQDHPSTPFGDRSILRVRTSAAGNGRHTYLKFEVSDCSGGTASATLWLATQDRELLGDLGIYRLTDLTWQEETLTWHNAPLAYDRLQIEAGPFAAHSWYGLPVGGLITGNGTWSLGLGSSSNAGQQDFLSDESVAVPHRGPYLELTCRVP